MFPAVRRFTPSRLPLRAAPLLVALTLVGCMNLGDRSVPIPTRLIAGSGGADVPTLVVVLPGRQDNVEVMSKFKVADAIHAGWPEVDVQLTSATLDYYLEGRLADRVRRQIIDPARAQGYQRLILMGASLGGMGSLIVDEANPGRFDQVILLAPYLGEASVMEEITAAGGIASWQPGPKPAVVDRSNVDRELWRHVQSFITDPQSRSRVWLAYGESDKLAKTFPVIAPALDSTQIRPRPGAHKWVVWNAAASEIFAELRAQSLGPH